MGHIKKLIYEKSDDCENEYSYAWTANGSLIVNPEDYPPLPQLANLQGYWKFEEISGIIYDETSNDNDGTYNGALYRQPGRVGYAAGFDGTDDYVDCGADSSLNFGSGDFSIAAWVKTSADDANIIIKRNADPLPKSYDLYFFAGPLEFNISDGTNYIIVTALTTHNDGAWHHVVGVRDGNTARLYVDGVENNTGDASAVGDIDVSQSMQIGIDLVDAGYEFDGEIDEVAMWNKALTAAEILAYYNWTK